MAEVINIDVCVIGGGTGRLSVADGFVQMGTETFLIAQSRMCGDCLNTGCIPSTALLAASKAANAPLLSQAKRLQIAFWAGPGHHLQYPPIH